MIWTASCYAKQNVTKMQLKTETIISEKIYVEWTQIFFFLVVSASWKNMCIFNSHFNFHHVKDMMRLGKKVSMKEWKI